MRRLACVAAVFAAVLLPSIPASAADTASIAGTVTDASGAPLDDVCVDVQRDYDAFGNGGTTVSVVTAADGTYLASDLPAGTHRIRFRDCAQRGLADTWYPAANGPSRATAVTVVEGQAVDGIDAVLRPAATMRGTLTDRATGAPLHRFCVSTSNRYGEVNRWTRTASDGTWSLGGLPADDYTVTFSECAYPSFYLPGIYPSQVGWNGRRNNVPVVAGETLVLDDTLVQGGRIQGQAKEVGGGDLRRYVLAVIYRDGNQVTSANAQYFDGEALPAGEYKIQFQEAGYPTPQSPLYPTQWYDGADDIASATTVTVTAGQVTTISPRLRFVPTPTFTSMSPAAGGHGGGDRVTIRGTDLHGVHEVLFGGIPGTDLTIVSPEELQVTTPAHPNGQAAVEIRSAGGSAHSMFTFGDRPTVLQVVPLALPRSGGLLTLRGDRFTGTTTVLIGGRRATNIRVLDDDVLQVTAPSGEPWIHDIVVIARGITSRRPASVRYL